MKADVRILSKLTFEIKTCNRTGILMEEVCVAAGSKSYRANIKSLIK